MASEGLTKTEIISILEIIEEARECSTREKLGELLKKAGRLLEADQSIGGVVATRGGRVCDAVNVVNGDYPEKWLREYEKEGLFHHDPVVKRHARFSNTHLWGDISKYDLDEKGSHTVEFAMDHGIRFGLSGSVYVPEKESVSILAFSGDKDRFGEHHREIADILMLHLGNALARLTYCVPVDPPPLAAGMETFK